MSLVTTRDGDELLEFHAGESLDLPESDRSIPLPLALVAVQHQGKILFIFNRWRKEWELPGGMIEAGERPVEAARRELLEESGQHVDALQFTAWMKFRLHPDQRLELGVLYRCALDAVQPFEANEEAAAILFWDLHSPVAEPVNKIDQYLAALALQYGKPA